MQEIIIDGSGLKKRSEQTLDFLEFVGQTRRKIRTIVVEETITPIKESLVSLEIKSKALEDEFLRDVIPIKKETGTVQKLWASGKMIFKKREEIFEDETTE